jgi:signal transduction histidine kinase/ligand-binding sensor domain-containing protein
MISHNRRRNWLFLLAWLPVLFVCIPAKALDPDRQISQYAHTAWRIQDGVFSGAPTAVVQTRDGYLWIGTESGLVRFDGVRFVPWVPTRGQRLPTSAVSSLLAASDGSLWIGMRAGLAHWKDDKLTTFPEVSVFVESILEDRSGAIWITRSQVRDTKGPLCQVIADSLHCHGSSEGISFLYAQPLATDSLGNLWVGSSLGIIRWKPDSSATYLSPGLRDAKGLAGVSAIAAGPQGSLWVGMKRSGKGLGLQELVQGQWKDTILPGMNGTAIEVSALLTDRDGSLWVGTTSQGIYRVAAGKADHFGSTDGLSSDSVSRLFEDRESSLWVVTNRGMDRFRGTRVTSFSKREGLTTEYAGSVVAARDGTVWIGNGRALNFIRNDKLSAIEEGKGLPGGVVTALFEDHARRLWVGIDNGLAVYEQGHFRAIKEPDGSPLGVMRSIVEDTEQNIWATSTKPALFRIRDFQIREEISPSQVPRTRTLAADPKGGIWVASPDGSLARYRQGRLQTFDTHHNTDSAWIRNILAEPDGSVWATREEGLIGWKDGRTQSLSSRNGLPCDSVFAAIRDQSGSLWLSTQCGYIVIAQAELDKWWQNPDTRVNFRVFDTFDGAQPARTNFSPSAARTADGKLWFVNDTILQMIDPSRLSRNEIKPPVQVEQIIADRKIYAAGSNLRLPARTRDIQIDYTALSLVVPEKVRFRYRLEGHDTDWEEPETRRQAFYSDLPPGNYRFHVIACNNDGVWNEAGAMQSFTIAPAFVQTGWFLVISLISATGLLWLLYTLRVRSLAAQLQTRLEERLQERERIARDLHDTLLQGIFSASLQLEIVEDRLPADSGVKLLVQQVLELTRKVGKDGRATIRSLRSSHGDDGLEEALSQIQKQCPSQSGVDFSVVTEGEPRVVRPMIRDEVYSIGREGVINAFRHSHAKRIEVEIEYGSRYLRMRVRDDGRGIDERMLLTGREGHWGLPGMRERADKIGAKLQVLSRIGGGTEIDLLVPGKLAFDSCSSGWLPEWLIRWLARKSGKDGISNGKKE